jgi:hypothetical protein
MSDETPNHQKIAEDEKALTHALIIDEAKRSTTIGGASFSHTICTAEQREAPNDALSELSGSAKEKRRGRAKRGERK